MELSIIIVNYNVQYFLENCLNSVFQALKDIDAEVIVVDNKSVDGSIEMLKSKFPQVKRIVNKTNQGFSKANNQAIQIAKGENILLLNPDTVVKEDTFKYCLRFLDQHPEAGGLGVKMLDGKGNFLPESKRGLPTPSVAFFKIFGLSQLFPKSKRFSKYHLGHLSKNENHEIDVLSGAFMMIRKEVLDKIGYLDENFFMYGEDIDLSYRITQAGYKNYYLAETSIIHYKGESTKKSSINYVFVFYRAMAIFAKKHFSQQNAAIFSKLINVAIYLRAGMAIVTRMVRHFLLPLIDGMIIYAGVYFFKNYYESSIKFKSGGAYPIEVDTYGIPLITAIYLFNLWIAGGYQIPTRLNDVLKGVFSGSIFLLITYSLLDESYRFSRAVILFTVLLSMILLPFIRFLLHRSGIRKFHKDKAQRIALVGKKDELKRISYFIKDTLIEPEMLCYVNADEKEDGFNYHAKISQLQDILDIYKVNEIIFCAKNLSATTIIKQMAEIKRPEIDFKIAPSESLYIIGSNSNQDSGEYYIMSTNALLKPINQRNKRILDFCLSLFFIACSPIFVWFSNSFSNYFRNLLQILFGKISFVGFAPLPKLNRENLRFKTGVLTPLDQFDQVITTSERIEKLNLEYGRDYSVFKDLEVIFKKIGQLGRKVTQ